MKSIITCILLATAAIAPAVTVAFQQMDGVEVTVTQDEPDGPYGYNYLIMDRRVTSFRINFAAGVPQPVIHDVFQPAISHWSRDAGGMTFYFYFDQDNGTVNFQSPFAPDYLETVHTVPGRSDFLMSLLAPAVPEPSTALLLVVAGLVVLRRRR